MTEAIERLREKLGWAEELSLDTVEIYPVADARAILAYIDALTAELAAAKAGASQAWDHVDMRTDELIAMRDERELQKRRAERAEAELAAAKAERGRLERHISAHQAMWDADYKIAQDAIASGAHLTSEVG